MTLLKTKVAEHVTSGSSPEEQLPLLQNAVKILETGLARCGTPGNCTELESGLSAMNSFVRYFERRAGGKYEPSRTPAPTQDGVTPLRITRKPRAEYTDAARRGGVSGNIRVLAILGANGKVEHVLLLNSLGYGLDQQVSAAARAIEFEPKKKDGIPVRSLVTLEYVFTIY